VRKEDGTYTHELKQVSEIWKNDFEGLYNPKDDSNLHNFDEEFLEYAKGYRDFFNTCI
jgi:hypothetical protein